MTRHIVSRVLSLRSLNETTMPNVTRRTVGEREKTGMVKPEPHRINRALRLKANANLNTPTPDLESTPYKSLLTGMELK